MEDKVEQLKKAAANFDAAMELMFETRESLKSLLNDFRTDHPEEREAMFRAVGYETLIAFWTGRMTRIAQDSPAKFATMVIIGEMARELGC